MPEHPDIVRLRVEYAARARQVDVADRYSLFNMAQLFTIQQRQRAMLKSLRRNGISALSEQRILEVGCGSGGVLLEALNCGARPHNLFGAELLFERIQIAHQILLGASLTCTDGQNLPFTSDSFDLSMQFTVFSSILDNQVKSRVAGEMLRVTRPGGIILWYDFWLNPTNRQTRGIRPVEIKHLFPNCYYDFSRLTLAPPLARRIVPISWALALILEKLSLFNSHYLAVIRPL